MAPITQTVLILPDDDPNTAEDSTLCIMSRNDSGDKEFMMLIC